eukprot:391560-Prorocentrum_minimum.AAC.1
MYVEPTLVKPNSVGSLQVRHLAALVRAAARPDGPIGGDDRAAALRMAQSEFAPKILAKVMPRFPAVAGAEGGGMG